MEDSNDNLPFSLIPDIDPDQIQNDNKKDQVIDSSLIDHPIKPKVKSDTPSVMSVDDGLIVVTSIGGTLSSKLRIPPAPDGGFGWVVVVASFFVHVLVLGNIYSFGVFYPVYIDEFNSSQASVAWVGSIGGSLMVGLGSITGPLADKYGNGLIVFIGGCFMAAGFFLASFSNQLWQLYLTQGIFTGIGYSLAFISGVSVVGQWFTERRGLAVGIAVSGSGLGQFAISQITGALIMQAGWRSTLRYLSLIIIVGMSICSLGIRRRLPKTAEFFSGGSHLSFFKDRRFSLLFIGSFLNSLGMFMPYTFIPSYAVSYGISLSGAVFILSMVGVSSALGRVSLGFFADKFGKLWILQLSMFCGGASTLCWMACTSFVSIMLFGIVFGYFVGGVISLMPSVCAELFGIEKIGSVLGLMYSSTAVGNLLSAPIGGFLLDSYNSYYPPIAVAGGFLLSGTVLVISIHFISLGQNLQQEQYAQSISEVNNLETVEEGDPVNIESIVQAEGIKSL